LSNIQIKRRADAQFKELPAAAIVMSDYEAAAAELAAKLARLKQLRLARDAAALAAPPKPAPAKKSRAKKKRPALSLSDWMKNRHAANGQA
jgi:hypothetical protein